MKTGRLLAKAAGLAVLFAIVCAMGAVVRAQSTEIKLKAGK